MAVSVADRIAAGRALRRRLRLAALAALPSRRLGSARLAGRAPLPRGGGALLASSSRSPPGPGSRSPGRSRRTFPGPSSTGRSSSPPSSSSGSCSARGGTRACRWRLRRSSSRSARPSSGRSPARRSPRSSRTAAAPRACATRSGTGTRSRSPPTCCSCSRSGFGAAGASRPSRAGGAMLAYAAIVAVLLAASRAGVAAAVLGVALWLWLGARAGRGGAARARGGPCPAVAVAAWAFSRPALVEDGQPRADRVADGAWFGAARSSPAPPWSRSLALELETTAARAGASAYGRPRARRPGGRRRARRADRARSRTRAGSRTSSAAARSTNDPGRLGSLSSNNRLDWWGEALGHLRGAIRSPAPGANTFEVARKRYRETPPR